MCTLFLGPRGLNLKCVFTYCHRRLSLNHASRELTVTNRNALVFGRASPMFPNQNRHKKLLGNVKLGLFSARTILTPGSLALERFSHYHAKDGLSDSYILIYVLPRTWWVKLGYAAFIGGCGGLIFSCYKLFFSDETFNTMNYGHFDDKELKGLTADELPYILGIFLCFTLFCGFLALKLPLRIYRLDSDERKFIAIFQDRLIPTREHKHYFTTATVNPRSIGSKLMLYKDLYQLGTRSAILFPERFQTMFDHDDMIDDFSGTKASLMMERSMERSIIRPKTKY